LSGAVVTPGGVGVASGGVVEPDDQPDSAGVS